MSATPRKYCCYVLPWLLLLLLLPVRAELLSSSVLPQMCSQLPNPQKRRKCKGCTVVSKTQHFEQPLHHAATASWQCFVRSGWCNWHRLHQRSCVPGRGAIRRHTIIVRTKPTAPIAYGLEAKRMTKQNKPSAMCESLHPRRRRPNFNPYPISWRVVCLQIFRRSSPFQDTLLGD